MRRLCHGITHVLGDIGYWDYQQKKIMPNTDDMLTCNGGFIGGFLSEYVLHGANIDKSEQFCEELITNDQSKHNRLRLECYQGIGHGIPLLIDTQHWKEEKTVVDQSVQICNDMNTPVKQNGCIAGVFGTIAAMYGNYPTENHGYTLGSSDKNHFTICNTIDNKYKSYCYVEMIIHLDNALYFTEALNDAISSIRDSNYQHLVAQGIGRYLPRRVNYNAEQYDNLDLTCRSLRSDLVTDCIDGVANGFTEILDEKELITRQINYCSLTAMRGNEKDSCFKSIIAMAFFPPKVNQVKYLCQKIPLSYKQYCNNPQVVKEYVLDTRGIH